MNHENLEMQRKTNKSREEYKYFVGTTLKNPLQYSMYLEFYQNKGHSYTIPWDECKYVLGDVKFADQYQEHTCAYYDFD